MRIPTLTGTIKRRLLVNFRADPEVVGLLLPDPFRPKLHRGFAVVGICLIRLEHERPLKAPPILGLASENAAHRFAVEWTAPDGTLSEGVFIPRRDTDSLFNLLVGERVFPIGQHSARFEVTDVGGHVELSMRSHDGKCEIDLAGDDAEYVPSGSCFESLDVASSFFRGGAIGFSPARRGERLDAVELSMPEWHAGAFAVSAVRSSYFEDTQRFPAGSVEFDHALIMRDMLHEWRSARDPGSAAAAAPADAVTA